jgi:hypothetical protein
LEALVNQENKGNKDLRDQLELLETQVNLE